MYLIIKIFSFLDKDRHYLGYVSNLVFGDWILSIGRLDISEGEKKKKILNFFIILKLG
jgi:hypothetical protein